MTKFTKGPWELFLTGDERCIYIGLDLFGSSNKVVTTVDCDDLPEAEAQANSRLIAAAPELYEALDDLVRITDDGFNLTSISVAIQIARAALAKARGEA